MTRTIETHKVNGLSEALEVMPIYGCGAGGANHLYHITDAAMEASPGSTADVLCKIKFQEGPIKETGVNGISNEALLAIVADRLECFQESEFSCRENAIALTKIQEAMFWLLQRTRERTERGVEGTSAV